MTNTQTDRHDYNAIIIYIVVSTSLYTFQVNFIRIYAIKLKNFATFSQGFVVSSQHRYTITTPLQSLHRYTLHRYEIFVTVWSVTVWRYFHYKRAHV